MGITEATRQRVLTAAQELGYKPNRAARALTTGRSEMIAICVPSSGEGYYASALHNLQSAATVSGYEVVVWEAEHEGSTRKKPSDLNVDGFLALDVEVPDSQFTDDDGIRKPGVNLGLIPRKGWDNVTIDVKSPGDKAFQHLIDMGCRHILYVRLPADEAPLDGLYHAFCDLNPPPGVFVEEIVCPGRERATVSQTVKAYVERSGKPDGLFCFNDSLAMAAKRALTELGIHCPKDVAIIGCGGTEEGEYSCPSLSTISHPIREAAQTAWEFLHNRLENGALKPQSKVIKAKFIARESSKGFAP